VRALDLVAAVVLVLAVALGVPALGGLGMPRPAIGVPIDPLRMVVAAVGSAAMHGSTA
jgi:hypothetical protein